MADWLQGERQEHELRTHMLRHGESAIRETSPTAKELMNVLDYLGGDHRQYFGWYKGYGVGNQ